MKGEEWEVTIECTWTVQLISVVERLLEGKYAN